MPEPVSQSTTKANTVKKKVKYHKYGGIKLNV